MHQLKLAFRQILLRPALSGLVVIMLAVGIGATTAVYSLFHQVLIEPLPVHEPERLVNLSSPGFKAGSTWGSESISWVNSPNRSTPWWKVCSGHVRISCT